MLGHLKAEDFMNLMDGTPLATKQRSHLESCARCAETLKSVEVVRSQITEMQMTADEHIPEPDWSDFRGDVRNALLSRSVKRETASRSLFGGLAWKPIAAWGMAALTVFALTTGIVVWNQEVPEPVVVQNVPVQPSLEPAAALEAMAQKDVFDDLLELDQSETENLQRLLDDLTHKTARTQ
jgi:hypothetical protein